MFKIFIYSIVAICFSIPALAGTVINFEPGAMKIVRIHSTHHATPDVQRMAIVQIDGLVAPCHKGVFFDATNNNETFSIILSSFVAKTSGQIAYNPAVTSPWGDTNYCALTLFDIK
jgi:hypothetical protein